MKLNAPRPGSSGGLPQRGQRLLRGKAPGPRRQRPGSSRADDRPEARVSLVDSVTFHQGLLNALTAHICVLDDRGTIVAVNRAWRKFAAANRLPAFRAGVGVNYFAICRQASGPDSRLAREVYRGLRAVLAGRLSEFVTDYPCHSPRTRRWFELRVTRAADRDQKWLVLTHRNITKRVRVEGSLRDSEQRLQLALTAARMGVWEWEVRTDVVYWSPECYAITGLKRFDRTLKALTRIVHPEDVGELLGKARQAISEGTVFVATFRVRRPDGAIRWLTNQGRADYDSGGRPLRLLGIVMDVTERRQGQELLQAQRDLFLATSNAQDLSTTLRLGLDTALRASGMDCGGLYLADPKGDFRLAQSLDCSGLFVQADRKPRLDRATLRALGLGRPVFRGGRRPPQLNRAEIREGLQSTAWLPIRHEGCVIGYLTAGSRSLDRVPASSRVALETLASALGLLISRVQANMDVRAMHARSERVREEERSRIAREVHDELGHAMADLRLDLAWLNRRLEAAGMGGRSALRARIRAMSGRAVRDAHTVRRIATSLRPPILDALGLAAAVEWQARDFEQRTGIACHVKLPPAFPALPAERVTAVFRVVQELLHNVAQHARASRVDIQFRVSSDQLELRVRDNGRGIEAKQIAAPEALGLLGMRERAAVLGGEFRIRGSPRHGTGIRLTIPIQAS